MTDQPTPKPSPARRTTRATGAAAKPTAAKPAAARPAAAKPAAKRAAPKTTAGAAVMAAAGPAAKAVSPAASSSPHGNGRGGDDAVPGSVAILARDRRAIVADTLEAPSADFAITRAALGSLEARDVEISQAAVGAARAERVSVQMGALGFALTGDLTMSQSGARTLLAREAHLEQSVAQTVIAEQVHMERGSNALIVIARRVDGEVRALLDWRGAVAFGVAVGIVLSIFRRGGGRTGRSGRRG
jgi:hypothetical protein